MNKIKLLLILITVLLLPSLVLPNNLVSAASKIKPVNDYNSLTVTKREKIMFQTYNAKLSFIGESYEGKIVKLAFRVTGTTARISFASRLVFSDGSFTQSGTMFSPEMRYYPNETIYVIQANNPTKSKLIRFDYTLDTDNSSPEYKSISISSNEKQKVFIPAIAGTPSFNIKTNYTKKDSTSSVTINNIQLSKSDKPLKASQDFNIFEGPSSNIAYILSIDTTTTSVKDNDNFWPFGTVDFGHYQTSYKGGNNDMFLNNYNSAIRLFAGVPRKERFMFNLTKSLSNMNTTANIIINGKYFIIDIKTGKIQSKPQPSFFTQHQGTYQWSPVIDSSGIYRVNTYSFSNEGYDEEEYREVAPIHQNLYKVFKTLSFTVSLQDKYDVLNEGYLNVYSNRDRYFSNHESIWRYESIPTENLLMSIPITKDMKPQDIKVSIEGLDSIYIAYFVKGPENAYKGVENLLVSDLLIK